MQSRVSSQWIMGLILVLLGVGFLLQSLGLMSFGRYVGDWWPLVIIILALTSFINNGTTRIGSSIMLFIGVVFLLATLDIVTINLWSLFWPLILMLVGFNLLFGHSRKGAGDDTELTDVFVAFGGDERKVTAKDYRGGNFTAIFGGFQTDMRQATFAKDATIQVFTAFGGGEFLFPKDVKVVSYATPIFGGWEDKSVQPEKPTATVVVRGTSLFGGVEIKN